jgi:gliding motility-associated-like protein
MRKFLLLLIVLSICITAFSQDQTNKGKDFWIPYPEHIDGTNSAMGLYITSDVNSTGVITVGATTIPFTIISNTVVYKFLGPNGGGDAPNTGVYLGGFQDNVVAFHGIHVTATSPVVVFAHIIRSARSGATLVLPTKVWGKEYIVPSYNNSGSSPSFAQINVYASVPNTTIEITPSVATRNGLHTPGVPFQVIIPQVGDVYQLQFAQNLDPSGTIVKSLASGSGGCNPIAVFSSTTWSGIQCNNASGGDNFFQQIFPTGSWGKQFVTGPLKKVATNLSDNNADIIRVFVKDPATIVTKTENGIATTLTGLTSGNFYEYFASKPTFIQADKAVQLIQYIASQSCGSPQTQSDPEMIALGAVEQTINDITVFSAHQSFVPPGQSAVNKHYINVIMKTSNTPLFRIDGVAPNAAFTAIPGTNYSYLKEDVTLRAASDPVFRLTADSGFSAIAYGFGQFESYGYNAGTNVKDLYQQIGVSTEYGIETTPSVCTGAPFRFKVSLPYQPDSIYWDIHNLPPSTSPNNNSVMVRYQCPPVTLPCWDSTTTVNGIPIYWYSLPSIYSANASGTFDITITTFFPNIDCGNSQDIDFSLQVSAPPSANFTWVAPGCPAEPVSFIDITNSAKPTYKWWWDFGDPASGAANNTSAFKNPTHTFSAPGTYTVRYANITTPGCLSDTIPHQVVVPKFPTATVSGTIAVCENGTPPSITFTGAEGKAPYTFTYNINGGANQTVNSVVGNTATVVVPTIAPGTFTCNLVSVGNTGSSLCTQNQTGSAVVTVNPLPTASISGNTTVCLNGASPNITFTGATGSAPYTFTYNINNGVNQTVTTTAGNTITVAVPTNVAGSFTYNLISVKDGTSTACTQNQNSSVTVVVKDLPAAAITGNAAVCLNAPSPNVTFTGVIGTAPYTFTYNINGGANQTVTTTTGNSITLAAPTIAAGSFIYNLVSVKEGSSNSCVQNQSGSVTIVVNPLPTASIAGAATVCLNANPPKVTFTGAGSVSPYTFTYNINGGANQTITAVTGNTVDVTVPTTISGTFTYNLVSVVDGSNTVCSQNQTGSTTVVVKDLPTALVTGTTNVCLNAASPNITFTGSVGAAPYTFTYNINNGTNQTVTTTTGNSVTVAVPTNAAGSFTYNLVTVKEGSGNACLQNQSGSATVIVNQLPTAAIAGNVSLCLNAAPPNITFTGSGTTAPYTFTYNINGGANQTVSTTTGNTVSIIAATNVAGTFTYNLVSVRDGSSTLCSQAQTGSAVVTIYPLPTLNFTSTAPSCETRLITFTDNTNPNAGTLTDWAWNFGDVNSIPGNPNTSTATNPAHTFSAAGNYTVSLTVITSNGCTNPAPFTKLIIINDRPKAGFIVPEVCINDISAIFTDTSKITSGAIDPLGYQWDFGDPASGAANTSATKDGTHLYTLTGSYTVRHIVTSALGCKDTTFNNIFINGADPLANFFVTNATTLCANDSVGIVNLSTIGQGSITKVEIYWDFIGAPTVVETDDFPAPNKVYKHKYPNFQSPLTRAYSIRLRAYSGTLCQDVIAKPVTVNAAPKVQFNAMPDACFDAAPFQITQAGEVGGVPGLFVYSGPGVNAAGVFSPALAGVGTHTIKYTFTSSAAGCTDTISRTIKVLDTATAKFSFTSPVCEGTAATFTEGSTAPAGVTLNNTLWNFGDGSPAEPHAPGSTFTHSFPGWGSYSVTMYNTSAYGCRSTSKVQQVYISPIPVTAFAFNETSVCLPDASVSFKNNSTIPDNTGLTYLWDFGDGSNTSTALTPTHVYKDTGPYTVKLTAKSNSNCTKTIPLVVDFIHPQPKADFDFSKPEVCIGDEVTFNDLTDGLDGTVVQWNWDFGDATTGNTKQVPHLYTTAKTYDVSLFIVNSQGCKSTTETKTFRVNPYPVVNGGGDKVVLEGGTITLQPVAAGNDLTYLWSPATYLNSVTSPAPIASNMLDDITYKLTVTGRGGCAAPPVTIFVKILKAPRVPNTITPNGDGKNEFWYIENLDTYPNCKVQVFTRTGQLVFESKGYKTPWNGTLNGKTLPIDTYYYIIEPGNGRKAITGYVTILK